MIYSFSTVLMTVLTSNLLIAVIVLCFRDRKIMLSIGYKLVLLFLGLTIVRFLFPVELPFTRNMNFFGLLAEFVVALRHPYISWKFIEISIVVLLGVVWIWGTVRRLRDLHDRKEKFRHFVTRYGINVSNQEPYRSMMKEICGGRKNPLWVVIVPYYGTPMQYGTFQPYIVLPKTLVLSKEELYCVLRHETAHYYHRDALIKDIIAFLCAVYWWNPLCKILQNKADMLLEMRVDDRLICGDAEVREQYCSTLDEISAKLQGIPSIPGSVSAISMAAPLGEDLKYRQAMMRRKRKRSQSLLFCGMAGLVATLYIGSYCFILEPVSKSSNGIDGTIADEKFYAVLREDGSYDIYIEDFYSEGILKEGQFIENVEDLEFYMGISIRSE